MSDAEHVYDSPQVMTAKKVLPKVARYLDDTDLLAKTQALRLSTVNAAGWPHAALLSAGDMLAVTSERLLNCPVEERHDLSTRRDFTA